MVAVALSKTSAHRCDTRWLDPRSPSRPHECFLAATNRSKMDLGMLLQARIENGYLDQEIRHKRESGRRYRGDAHVGVLRMLLLG